MGLRFIVFAFVLVAYAVPSRSRADAPGQTVFERAREQTTKSVAGDTLTLDQVLVRVAERHPALQAVGIRAEAARGDIQQAGAWPNPEVVFEGENIDGSYDGFDSSELSLWLFQELELGGKRPARVARSERIADEAMFEADVGVFEVYLETKHRYAEVMRAQERLRLLAEAERLVTEVVKSAEDRVRAGAALISDGALAEAAMARVRMVRLDAEAESARARIALSALWGEPSDFGDPLPRSTPLPPSLPADSVVSWASRSPELSRLQLSIATQRAEVAVERSLRMPDLSAGAGARRLESDDATTWLFGLALPLPLWDRRGGAIRAADARVRVASLDVARTHAALEADLANRVNALSRLGARLREMGDTVIPGVEAALESMLAAYRIGRVSYADLLEVQRTLIEMEQDQNDVRFAIAEEVIAIERITGRSIEELTNNE